MLGGIMHLFSCAIRQTICGIRTSQRTQRRGSGRQQCAGSAKPSAARSTSCDRRSTHIRRRKICSTLWLWGGYMHTIYDYHYNRVQRFEQRWPHSMSSWLCLPDSQRCTHRMVYILKLYMINPAMGECHNMPLTCCRRRLDVPYFR